VSFNGEKFLEWTRTGGNMARALAEAKRNVKDRIFRGFRQYMYRLFVSSRAKVNGPVLKRRSGRLYESFRYDTKESAADIEGSLYETRYGAMWEHTGHGIIRPVTGCRCAICSRSTSKWLHFKTPNGWVRTQEVRAVPAKPHIAPTIVDLRPLWFKLVSSRLFSEVFYEAFTGGK